VIDPSRPASFLLGMALVLAGIGARIGTAAEAPGFGSRTLNGHGIGDLLLEEGMTVGNNIDLHDRRWKSDVGVMFADFMVVRPGGAELLVNTPRELGIGGSPVA